MLRRSGGGMSVVVGLWLATAGALAQINTGTVLGTVKDAQGGVIPGATEASFVTGLGYSPDVRATLDVRHFTAANGDCLGFLERHYARTSSVHLGDRRRNNGRSAPYCKRALA